MYSSDDVWCLWHLFLPIIFSPSWPPLVPRYPQLGPWNNGKHDKLWSSNAANAEKWSSTNTFGCFPIDFQRNQHLSLPITPCLMSCEGDPWVFCTLRMSGFLLASKVVWHVPYMHCFIYHLWILYIYNYMQINEWINVYIIIYIYMLHYAYNIYIYIMERKSTYVFVFN